MELYKLSASEMKRQLQTKEISSVEIVESLLRRKEEIEPQINSLVHHFDEEALKRAKEADEKRSNKEELGELHGLPLTIKENIATKGTSQTMGIISRKKELAKRDSVIVEVAKEQGGIILGKSNIPLLLLSFECDNDIWGPCNNPWNLERVPGGSSGGEAAAIASGISPMGIGSDIGGSIRIPSAWCGIVGLKPTVGRWSSKGSAGAIRGQEFIRAQIGPMARTTEDLVLMMNALSGSRQSRLDPTVPSFKPISLVQNVKGLRIGYYLDDGFFEPSQSIQRAVLEAKQYLEQAGAVLVPYRPSNSWEIMRLYFQALSADGAQTLSEALGGQAVNVQLKNLFRMAKLPRIAQKLLSKAMKKKGEARVALLLEALGSKTVVDYWKLTAKRTELQREEMDSWLDENIDVLIGPPSVTVAAKHKETGDWSMGAYHTMRYNLLDLPAGVVPVSRVLPGEDTPRDIHDRLDRKAAMFEKDSVGLPLNVQVIGKPWQEENVLRVMNKIEQLARESKHFPHTPV